MENAALGNTRAEGEPDRDSRDEDFLRVYQGCYLECVPIFQRPYAAQQWHISLSAMTTLDSNTHMNLQIY